MENKITSKLRIHPRNFCEEELIVNLDILSKDKFHLEDGDIIEISVPKVEDDDRSHLFLQVKSLPQEIQSKGGPLSISKELAQTFNLEGVKEVSVKKVEREEVGLDLVELRFKDQCLTRSDMWRFSSSLIGKCVYISKKVEFASIRCQVSGLWAQGEKVQCGAIISNTRVVFRSASAHFFIFIQISSEMWEFDPSGDLYFDKAQSGFLKELFQRWKEEKCSHEVTLIFFWRMYYSKETAKSLPSDAAVRSNRDTVYEDFYKVIAQGESAEDWSSYLVNVKKHFLHLREVLLKIRGKDATVSKASEGNILEAINLAVNVYEKSYQNCHFQLTGQQIVIVTSGVGVFEVERDLTMTTRERIIDMGVGVDLIALTKQPLHAVPLFKFHSARRDNQEYYNLPHWINYSFYNPVHPWNRYRFQPTLRLSDNLINTYLNRTDQCVTKKSSGSLYQPHRDKNLSPHTHSSSITLKKARAFFNKHINHDDYDAAIFKTERDVGRGSWYGGMTKVHSTGNMSVPWGDNLNKAQHGSLGQDDVMANFPRAEVSFKISSSPQENEDPFEADIFGSPSSSHSISSNRSGKHVMQEVASSYRGRVQSESYNRHGSITGNASSFTLCPAVAGSAESLPKYSIFLAESHGRAVDPSGGDRPILVATKKVKFINPFDPTKVHGELTAYHRRWVHTFPRNKCGLAFQTHHALHGEGEELDSISSTSTLTLSPPLTNRSNGSLTFGSYQRTRSDSRDEQEFRVLHQVGRRSHGVSISSSFGETYGVGYDNVNSNSHTENSKPNGDILSPENQNEKREKSHSHSSSRSRMKQDSTGSDFQPDKSNESPPKRPNLWKRRDSLLHRTTEMAKVVEDFTSVRRTGVDWKSLTEPACLPITVDFFPSDSKLDQDYYFSPSKLLVSSFGSDVSMTSSRTLCPWIADHQKVDTFQAFREMISQRLSQGFQLAFNSKGISGQRIGSRWSGQNGSDQVSISSLHTALTEQKEALSQKTKDGKVANTGGGSIAVKLSLGKVYQKLELTYPDIVIKIYKQKVQFQPKPYHYAYQLCGVWPSSPGRTPDQELFCKSEVKFEYKRVEDYNWNFLDQHVCGHSDFEVPQESHKFWRCRYLLLPSTPPPSPEATLSPSPSLELSEEQEKLMTREGLLISNFVRFMEFLNHIKRTQPQHHLGKGSIPLPSYRRCHSIQSMSSHGSVTPSRGLATPYEFGSRITSPITIQSLVGTKMQEKMPEIEEDGSSPSGNLTKKSSVTRPESRNRLQTPQNTPGGMGKKEGLGREERRSIRNEKRPKLSVPSSMYDGAPLLRASSQEDLARINRQEDTPTPYSSLRIGKESPKLLRRQSRDNILSPTPHESTSKERGGKKDTSALMYNSKSTSARNRAGSNKSNGPVEAGSSHRSRIEKSPEIAVDSVSEGSFSTSSFDVSIQLLDKTSPPVMILKAMENQEEGIDFLGNLPGVGDNCCFIAMEAVTWAMEKIGGVTTRKDGVELLQMLVKEQLVLHASLDLNIPFLDGFLFYCVPKRMKQEATKEKKEALEQSFEMVSPEYEAFSKRWFEVIVEQLSLTSELNANLDRTPSPSPYAGYSPWNTRLPYYVDFGSRRSSIPGPMVNHYVELNPDSQFRSDRPEWCFVRYDHTYCPHRGFQFEMQWMVATITLFNQLIQSWTHKAAMCDFNLVPVPNLCKEAQDSQPFNSHQYIPIQFPCTFPGSSITLSEAIQRVMSAIILRLGFIQDPASTLNDDLPGLGFNLTLPITTHFYIHHSGSALLQPTCAESLVKLMERERRTRTSSQGTTLGRGDYMNEEELQYTGRAESGRVEWHSKGPSRWSLQGESDGFVRQNSSTPIGSPEIFNHNWIENFSKTSKSSGETGSRIQCGFYWFRNSALFRHRASAQGESTYEALREKLVALCSDKDGQLSELLRTLGLC